MELSDAEIEFMTQVNCAKMLISPSAAESLKLYGPKVTQNALDFLSMLLNQAVMQENIGDKADGNG